MFNLIESLLELYGFDIYVGFLHTEFYNRKSLVCDIVEPFRPIIDLKIRKAINLKQINEDDFYIINNKYSLNWKNSSKYINFLMESILDNKKEIFLYVQSFYRSFMKGVDIKDYPIFKLPC